MLLDEHVAQGLVALRGVESRAPRGDFVGEVVELLQIRRHVNVRMCVARQVQRGAVELHVLGRELHEEIEGMLPQRCLHWTLTSRRPGARDPILDVRHGDLFVVDHNKRASDARAQKKG